MSWVDTNQIPYWEPCFQKALYICDKVDRIYFSRSGCVEVGIIPREFPHPMEELNVVDTNNAKEDTEHAIHGLKHV